MTDKALELYLYMNSPEEVIRHLKEKGVTDKDSALRYLKPHVRSNVYDVLSRSQGSLAGTVGCLEKVIKHFDKPQ